MGEVARSAGVSTGTVSRVLNDRPGVHSNTKERVLEAMRHLGYRPDQAARELSFARGIAIGLHISYGIGRLRPFFSLFQSHLSRELRDSGMRFEEVASTENGMPAHLLDGMVLFGAHDADPRVPYLQERGVPLVLIGRHESAPCVAPDDIDGGRQAAEHLMSLGHRDIACILGGLHSQGEYDRLLGFRNRLKADGIELASENVLDGEFTSLGAYRATRRSLELGATFTAIFAASDEMAAGAIAAAEDHGVRVPMDLSVVGFDDIAEIMPGRLTTVRQSIAALAHNAVELLGGQLEGAPPRSVILPVQLVVRKSTSRNLIF